MYIGNIFELYNMCFKISCVVLKDHITELVSSIRYKLECAYSDDSNQSAHPHSLIRVLVFR